VVGNQKENTDRILDKPITSLRDQGLTSRNRYFLVVRQPLRLTHLRNGNHFFHGASLPQKREKNQTGGKLEK